MTDKIHALTVILETPIRDDDIEPLVRAIKHLRGVLDVKTEVADIDTWAAEERALVQLRQKLRHVLWPSINDPRGDR